MTRCAQLALLALATAEDCKMMQTPDQVGAYPIHALLVANTPRSVELCTSIFYANPQLLLLQHAESGPFIGEVW